MICSKDSSQKWGDEVFPFSTGTIEVVTEITLSFGRTKKKGNDMDAKEFTDVDGKKRMFEFKSFPCPTGFVYEATEIQNGEPKGMRFSVLGTENEAEVWRYKLEERLKKALKVKHIEYHKESHTWTTCDQIIRGQIRWDDETEGETPLIVVDGKDLTWTEFGKTIMTYEGFQFVMRFVDPSDDMYETE